MIDLQKRFLFEYSSTRLCHLDCDLSDVVLIEHVLICLLELLKLKSFRLTIGWVLFALMALFISSNCALNPTSKPLTLQRLLRQPKKVGCSLLELPMKPMIEIIPSIAISRVTGQYWQGHQL